MDPSWKTVWELMGRGWRPNANISYLIDDLAYDDIDNQVAHINLNAVDKTDVVRLHQRVVTYKARGYTSLVDDRESISSEEAYSMRMMLRYSPFAKWTFEAAKLEDCEEFLFIWETNGNWIKFSIV